jgi:hypothetical protein
MERPTPAPLVAAVEHAEPLSAGNPALPALPAFLPLHHLRCRATSRRLSCECPEISLVHATPELITLVTGALSLQAAPGCDDIDFLGARYLEAESEAAEAYRVAVNIDQTHERLKERLILLADLASTDATHEKLLRGRHHQVRVTYRFSDVLDNQAVNAFATMLRRNGVRGLFPEVFEGRMLWQLRPGAEEFLGQFRLPDELQDLYKRCRRVDRTPTLEVHRI